jgi:hypothetical protein
MSNIQNKQISEQQQTYKEGKETERENYANSMQKLELQINVTLLASRAAKIQLKHQCIWTCHAVT